MERRDTATLAAFLGFVLLAGANGTAISFLNRELAPEWGAALRFLCAGALFAVAAVVAGRRFPTGRALLGAVLYGALAFAGTFGLIHWAMREVKPGLTQVVVALIPLLTLVLAVVQRQERFRPRALVGAIASLAGIAAIFHEQLAAPASAVALLALVGAALFMAQATIVAKRFPKADIVATNGVAMGTAGILLLAVSFALGEEWKLPVLASTMGALAYLILAGTLAAFGLFLLVVQRWSASTASFQWVLMPLVAVPLSALLTQEAITPSLLAGGLLILIGVYVGALRQPSAPPAGSA